MSLYPHYEAPHYVYRYYDAAGALLYIGCTYQPVRRQEQHAKRSPWFSEVDSVRHIVYPSRAYALQKEREAIETEGSRYNKLRVVA